MLNLHDDAFGPVLLLSHFLPKKGVFFLPK